MIASAPMFEGLAGDVFIIVILLFIIVAAIRDWLRPKKKTRTINEVAEALGLTLLTQGGDELLRSFSFINRLQYGKKKRLLHALSGNYHDTHVTVLEMRYETKDIAKDAPPDTYCFFIARLPSSFPEITIYKEGLISKLYQATGHRDINFESHEFSRKFRVRAEKDRFAYDLCNPRMIEYLLKNMDLSIEIDRDALCISFNKPLDIEKVEYNLQRLIKIRSLIPEYLFGN